MFDTVHLFKCIRNNWLNQIDSRQTFVFPNFENPDKKDFACVNDLKMLYINEENQYIKLAPALSRKVLFPTSIERQSVSFCCRLFDEKNIAALNENCAVTSSSSNSSTAYFLSIILRWWQIVNVKHLFKWIRFNEKNYKPISSSDDKN